MSAELREVEVNGIKVDVIYEYSNYIPSISMQFIFKDNGYLHESINGLGQFSAALLNEGTKKEGSYAFAKRLDAKAISLHASTGNETFNLEVEALSEYFDEGVGMMQELINDPNYSKEAYEKVLKLSLARIEKYKSDYDYIASHKLKSIIFEGSHLAHPKIGDAKSLKSITIEDTKAFINTALGHNNAVVVVGGDISFEKAKHYIQKILSPLSKVTNKQIEPLAVKSSKVIHEVNEPETQQAYIYFGAPLNLKYNDKDQYKAKVAEHILGAGGFGSRMMEEIRVKRGLAYSVGGHFANYRYLNYFSGRLQTKLESQKEAIDVIKEMVAEFVAKGVTQEELEKAKQYILGSEPLKNEALGQRLYNAFNNYYYERGMDYKKRELKLIENLSLKELNSFIASHPEIKELTFAVVTAKKEK
ncbi:MAG: pitrilysin family protein [Campylobacterota bacterium]|nr:pitrilysin family protein [Campylobacterota bacterium]